MLLVSLGVSVAIAAPAIAEPIRDARSLPRPVKVLPAPPPGAAAAPTKTPKIIYLERCIGGCDIRRGATEDARTLTSTIPPSGVHRLSEFAGSDETWNAVVKCVKEVYSPYGVTVTDVKPADTEDYNANIVAGTFGELGIDPAGGIAPIMGNCNPVDHAISFSFANIYPEEDFVNEVCWTIAQEVGHTYGLDHSFEFFDGTSACNDPMTYRRDCLGQKFFRNVSSKCGEYVARDRCLCGDQQNTHGWLTTVMGPGTPITTASATLTAPADGATIVNGAEVHVTGGAQRGVAGVDLVLNGYRWLTLPGAPFDENGQLPRDYVFTLPADVPDGVIDIETVVRDDLGISATQKVTVTKGAPCASAASCAEGQKCEAGKCFWDPPTGVTGDACDYPQFCVNARCETVDGVDICTESCRAGSSINTCPEGLACHQVSGDTGVCGPPEASGGCCSTSRDSAPWGYAGIAAVGLGLVLRRRRR